MGARRTHRGTGKMRLQFMHIILAHDNIHEKKSKYKCDLVDFKIKVYVLIIFRFTN